MLFPDCESGFTIALSDTVTVAWNEFDILTKRGSDTELSGRGRGVETVELSWFVPTKTSFSPSLYEKVYLHTQRKKKKSNKIK